MYREPHECKARIEFVLSCFSFFVLYQGVGLVTKIILVC